MPFLWNAYYVEKNELQKLGNTVKKVSGLTKRVTDVCQCAAPKPPALHYIGSKLVLCSWCGSRR